MINVVEFLQGKREQIATGEESTYGTTVTPTEKFGRNPTFDPNRDAQNWINILGSGEDTINVGERELGPKDLGGTLSFAPQNWIWLKYVICRGSTDITDTDNTTYYEHTFSEHPTVGSFTLERAMRKSTGDNHVLTRGGCQVNNMGLSIEAGAGGEGALLSVNLEVWAQSIMSGTSVTSLSAPTTNAFQFRNLILNIDGTEVAEVKRGNLNVANNLHPARYANYTLNRQKGESQPEKRKWDGNFTVLVKDSTFYDLWDAASTVGSTSFVFKRGTNDKLTLTPADLRLESKPNPTNLEGHNQATLNWNAKNCSVVAQDDITSY